MEKNKIKLQIVSKSDYRFLYNLLKERDSRANISHKKIYKIAQVAQMFSSNVKFLPKRPGERYASKG